MPVSADPGLTTGWPERAARARLHYVSGKGGTGKSTVAAGQALGEAAGGRRGQEVAVVTRQSIAHVSDLLVTPR